MKRNFSFGRLNQTPVNDIIDIPTGEGWRYLVILKDLCTCKIVGYTFVDGAIALEVLDMARCYHPWVYLSQ